LFLVPEEVPQLQGRIVPFICVMKYFGVIFYKRIEWGLHIGKTATKAFGT
jgi:hypothetical protein